MTVVYACIAPHGSELVPRLSGATSSLFNESRNGMRTLAALLETAEPDTIVVASPHNLRLEKHIGIVLSENSSGVVEEGNNRVELKVRCDRDLGHKVLTAAEEKGLPAVGANYGALEGPASDLAMDWGTLIPLWFFLRRKTTARKVLIVTPSRGIPLRENFEFGRVLAQASERERKRIAFVASSDQAHTHARTGPYGFSRGAAQYDRKVVEAVKTDRLASLMDLDTALVERAKPDSLWQMTMLAGVLEVIPMLGRLVSYEVPTYFGMLCAAYMRAP